jgi:hypothetical protein
MSRSLWSVVVAALFAIVLQWTPLPAQARATLILLAWVALALSCIGWLLAHTKRGQQLRSHRKAARPMVLLVVFVVGGCLTVATWLLIPRLTAEQSPLAQESNAPPTIPTATPLTLSPPPTPQPTPTSGQTATTISIYPPFEEVYENYKKELGQPLNIKPQMIEQAYHARHEKATFLVIHDNWIYVLRENDQLTRVADGIVGEGENFTWYDDKDNLTKFSKRHGKPKDNLRPPWGTVAKTWHDHPKYEWFGWRVWHCWNRNYAYVQKFEHGLIVGSFRQWPEADAMRVDYVLVIDANATKGKWYPEVPRNPEGSEPPCEPPLTDKETITKLDAARKGKT